jgi:hypothetical protein
MKIKLGGRWLSVKRNYFKGFNWFKLKDGYMLCVPHYSFILKFKR